MAKVMISNRLRRVYDDYLKNSRFRVVSLFKHWINQHYPNTALHYRGGILLCLMWRWVSRLLSSLSEHGGKHPLCGLGSGHLYVDQYFAVWPFFHLSSEEYPHDSQYKKSPNSTTYCL